MLKRGLIVVIVILLLACIYQIPKLTGYSIFSSQEKISYSSQLVNLKILSVELSNNQITALIQNPENINLKLFIVIEGASGSDANYDTNILAAKETKKYIIDYNTTKVGTPKTLTITAYLQGSSGKIIYKFSETSFPITQISVSPVQNTTQSGEDTQILTASENQETTYIYANGLVASLDDQGNINYYHKDNLGSIRAITNSVGAVVYSTSYEPFGNEFSESGSSEYSYTGKPKDNSGLYYYGARYYDASLGRFTQIDPILDVSQSPYAYVRNNPLKLIDPTGMKDYSVGGAPPLRGKDIKMAPIDPITLFTDTNSIGMSYFRVAAASRAHVDPIAAAAAFVSEGFNVQAYNHMVAMGLYYNGNVWRDIDIDTFSPVGLDSFVDQMPILKAKGLLRSDFTMADTDSSTTHNERGEAYHQGRFATTPEQVEAFVAMYADFQQQFFADANSFGYNPSTFSQEAIDTWTYRYYITGRYDATVRGRKVQGARSDLRDALEAAGSKGLIKQNPTPGSRARKGQKAAATAAQFRDEL